MTDGAEPMADAPSAPGAPSSPSGGTIADARTAHRLGPWSLRCEGDEISEIAWRGTVLLESVRPALRDRDWDTVAPQVLEEEWTDPGADEALSPDVAPQMTRTLRVRYDGAGGEASAVSVLTVTPERLSLHFTITPDVGLTTNRVGLTAMLPRAMAGDDAVVTTVRGDRRDFRFPRQISPWQPLFDIRALDLDHAGERARLELLGDVFEMEDQRNWTDASFKIYSRPLALPFPYEVAAGESVTQEITLVPEPSVAAPQAAPGQAASAQSSLTPTAPTQPARRPSAPAHLADLLAASTPCTFPRLGLGATTEAAAVRSGGPLPISADAGFDHLMVEVSERFGPEWVLAAAAREAAATGLPVDLRIIASERTDIPGLLAAADAAGLPVRRIGIVDEARHVTTAELWERLRTACRERDAELVAGSRTHFTELNREVYAIPGAELLSFPSTPQMHMRESWHVVESVAALGDVLVSARMLRPTARLHLGPLTLRPRVNAVATQAELVDRADETGWGAHLVPGSTDPRQRTAWAAAWAAAALAEAAHAGVETVTLGELAGARGVLTDSPESPPTPLGELLVDLAAWSGREVRVLRAPGGPGTVLITRGEEVLLVNARLEDWVAAEDAGEGESLRVPAGTVRRIVASAAGEATPGARNPAQRRADGTGPGPTA
ncbi:hypothetical protein [Brachybacterium sp. ACRRE]|uniref:hypothetical protein n=1 Tax=Brachybacterium sp. ACRRE TaxID=2918184 RepID=UPI001EF29B29|nr:hypothetical protein [Brachybacterium sp. ACRRE]MCG7308863.1 hypothetical protein [Brachybacterium sp. ACRRE]